MKRKTAIFFLIFFTACSPTAPEKEGPPTIAPLDIVSIEFAPTPTSTSEPTSTPTAMIEPTPPPAYWAYIQPGARFDYSFEELAPQLNTPELMLLFLQNNTTRRREWDIDRYQMKDYWQLPETLHEEGTDDGDAMSRYAVCGLEKLPEWAGTLLKFHYAEGSDYTHTVGLLEEISSGDLYIFDSNDKIYGPFDSTLSSVNAYRQLFKFDGFVNHVDICPVSFELAGHSAILPYVIETFEP